MWRQHSWQLSLYHVSMACYTSAVPTGFGVALVFVRFPRNSMGMALSTFGGGTPRTYTRSMVYKLVENYTGRRGGCNNPNCATRDARLKLCAKCGMARYCSKDCQTTDWAEHKTICKNFTPCAPVPRNVNAM